jgi:hypothetical protein
VTEERPPTPAADRAPDDPPADPSVADPPAAAAERLDELADPPRSPAPAAGRPADRLGTGRLDELLADPPDLRPIGALTGYRDGARLRRRILVVLVLGIVGAVLIGRYYVRWLEERQRVPAAEYQLAAGAEDESRPDALVWTDGVARLGITRQDPGVKAIVLPDRVITLAPGCDHAQIKVEVQDGKTVMLKVLVGEIRETPLAPESGPSSRDATKGE